VVFVAAALFFRFTSQLPHGEWDAWAIWNLRAAFLSVPDAHWRDGFTPLLKWSHPDYPLLLPSSVARLWIFGEHGSVSGPRLLAAAFVSSSALVMAGSVARRAGTAAMSLALALLLVPTYIYWASSQTADVAIGSYVLIAAATLSAVSLPGRYVVAGLAAGFAVWTKNEGLVAAAAIAVSALIGMGTPGGPRRELLRFATAFAVAAVPLLLFKITLSPASDLLTQIVHDDPLGKVTQATRHLFVAGHLVRELSQWGGLTPVPATALLLPCVVLAARRGRQFPRDAAQGATIVGLMLVVYYIMYVLSPYDLEWHIRTSAPRLIAQVWPVIVWSCVIAWLAPASSSGRTSDGALPSRPTTS
jgi:hypothetical protein